MEDAAISVVGIDNHKTYPLYKDTGVEWLGKIPVHWEANRLKYAVTPNPTAAEVRNLCRSLEVSFVPMEAVGEYGGLELTAIKPLAEVYSGYTYFREGDIVIAKITPCFENGKGALATGLVNGIAFGTTELHVLRVGEAVVPGFLFYVSLSDAFRKLGEAEMYGAGGQKRVPDSFIKNLKHPLPPFPEQCAIATFLDRETTKIDALVAKKERLIELLQEKRVAVITQAVTKGLDPAVQMRDSGVKWIGKIPVHWDVKKLKYTVPEVTVGIVVTPSKYYVVDGIPCLRSLNITQGHVDRDDLVFISESANILHRKSQIFDGDIVVVRTGRAGVAAIVPTDFDGANCIDLLIIRRSSEILSTFLYYLMNSSGVRSQVSADSVGSIQEHYNTVTLSNLPVPSIPVAEQLAICAFLDRETTKIDTLLTKARTAIDRLKELRAALISAAVTGKIDVRDEADPAPEAAP